jgi:hypothetical protein
MSRLHCPQGRDAGNQKSRLGTSPPDDNNKICLLRRDPAWDEDCTMIIWQHLLKARRCAHLSTGGPARMSDSSLLTFGAAPGF